MARSAAALMEEVAHLDPRAAAERLVAAQRHRAGWLDAFAEHLDRQRNAESLERILGVWGLNQSDAARLFGVSRQAISKWLQQGVPADRAEIVADVAAATDLLVRHLQRDRVAAVVRRRAPSLGDQSLLELLERGRSRDVLAACRAMFAFTEAHA
jgi:predicted transcriptional regulator